MSQFFSETLKKLRNEKGLSQQALADKIFVTRPTVARWESGSRLPDASTITRLAEILGVDVNFLLLSVPENSTPPHVIMVDDRKLILNGGLLILEDVMPSAVVSGFTNAEDAVAYAKTNNVSLAILDIELRNTSGLDLCKKLLEINPHTNVVFLTAYSNYSLDAWSTGASGFMLKPITAEGLKEQLKNLRHPFFLGGEKGSEENL